MYAYVAIATLLLVGLAIQHAYARVFVPKDEFKAYFNSDGLYTIVGLIKSTEDSPVRPTIHIEVRDGQNIIQKTVEWVPIVSPPALAKDIPFKIVMPEVRGSSPVVTSLDVTFKEVHRKPVTAMVVYDDTLKMQGDHATGMVKNFGNDTIHDLKMYAAAYDQDAKLLDVGTTMETFDLAPGQVKNFTMYIDPAFAGKTVYYSCFAPSDPYAMTLTAARNDEPYEFYAYSQLWIINPQFDREGHTLHVSTTSNSLPVPVRITLKVPVSSLDEEFQVYFDGKKAHTFQNLAQDGINWHISFDYPARSWPKDIGITGFADPQYRYFRLNTTKDIQVVAQVPHDIKPQQENVVKLVFLNSTNDLLLRDTEYNVQFVQRGNIVLDVDRNAAGGSDTISPVFPDTSPIDMKISLSHGNLRGSAQTSIVAVPEFPAGVFVMAASVAAALSVFVYRKYRY